MKNLLGAMRFKGLTFSASANAMSTFQSTLEDFLGGGISIQGKNDGFSTVLDPITGTYKTTIKAGTVTATSAGVGQSPVSFWQQLTTTSSGNWILIGVVLIAVVLGFSMLKGRR
jgi:hypothetical protein